METVPGGGLPGVPGVVGFVPFGGNAGAKSNR